jgi:hypothetical protein
MAPDQLLTVDDRRRALRVDDVRRLAEELSEELERRVALDSVIVPVESGRVTGAMAVSVPTARPTPGSAVGDSPAPVS